MGAVMIRCPQRPRGFNCDRDRTGGVQPVAEAWLEEPTLVPKSGDV
jgi:hypothetical protein